MQYTNPIAAGLNAFSTASNIKSARLNIQQKEKELDRQAAGEKLRANVFSEDGLPQEEVERLSVLAPGVAKDIQATQQKTAQVESLTNYYMKRGLPKEEASLKATGYAKDIDTFDKEYRTKTKFEQEQVRTGISQQGQMIQNLMKVAQKNPQQANQMYQDYIASKNEQIKELLREGQTEIADKLQESIDKAPPSLIKPDGTFDAEFPMMSLSKMSAMMANAETWDAQTKSDIKIAEKKAMPGTRGTPTKLAKLYAERDAETDPERIRAYDKAIAMEGEPKLKALGADIRQVDNTRNAFALKMGIENPYALATVDTRKWTPEQRAEGNDVASIMVRGLKPSAKEADKRMASHGALSAQMENATKAYKNVGEFRLLDETTKNYWSNYMGLSKRELESTEASAAFNAIFNIKGKLDSGATITNNEMTRQVGESATPSMTKSKILLGIKNMAKRQVGELNGLKKVMGPLPFNLKYGTVLRSYEDLASAVDTVKETKKDEGFMSFEEVTDEAKKPRQVIERRIAPDGRIIVKYSDNTYGVE